MAPMESDESQRNRWICSPEPPRVSWRPFRKFKPLADGIPTEQSARPCRSVRLCRYLYGGQRTGRLLQTAVELRLGKKRAGQLQRSHWSNAASSALIRSRSSVLRPSAWQLSTSCCLIQPCRVWEAQPILGGDRLNGRPQGGVLATVLLYHACSALADFGECFGIFSWLHSLRRWSLHETRGGSLQTLDWHGSERVAIRCILHERTGSLTGNNQHTSMLTL